MKPEDQIKALAELDSCIPKNRGSICADNGRDFYWSANDGSMEIVQLRYLTFYDAIIPLIQKQSDDVKIKAQDWLCGERKVFLFTDATPDLFCEALLRATGKWVD